MHQESQDWVKTIEEEKGYNAIDAVAFRGLLRRMDRYEICNAALRHLEPGRSVLEAGCGWALCSFALAERGMSVTAVDISEKLVHDLKRLQSELGGAYASNLTFVAWDIFRLPELQKAFDAVISDGTYEHFLRDEDRRTILENVRAVLRDRGAFIVAVPNLHNPLFRFVVDQKMPTMHPFTIQALTQELSRGGFRVLETGFSFVNPGFEQWLKSRWMAAPIHAVNAIFRLLPRSVKKLLGAHLYCVAEKI